MIHGVHEMQKWCTGPSLCTDSTLGPGGARVVHYSSSRWCKGCSQDPDGARMVHWVHRVQEWYTGPSWCKGGMQDPGGA
jgi:hypothetical protein